MFDSHKKRNSDREPSTRYGTINREPYSRGEEPVSRYRHADRSLGQRELYSMYQDFLEKSRYTEADQIKAHIADLEQRRRKHIVRTMSASHSREKQSLRRAQKTQIKKFKQAWEEFFIQQASEQRMAARKLQMDKKQMEKQCEQRIHRRCQSAKPRSSIAKLYSLEKQEHLLRKEEDFLQLRAIRSEKRSIVSQIQEEQRQLYNQIIQEEKKRTEELLTRRYSCFVQRVERTRKDNQRLYKREEQRLKQKYRNILKNLEHDQKLSSIQI